MALRKVGVIFTAEGYSQYMGELKQVTQEMRTMATQSKLAVAQLGNNASTTDTYKAKMKSMGDEIQVSGQRTKMLTDLQKTLSAEQKRLPGMVEKSKQKYEESNVVTKDLKKSYEKLAKAKGEDAEETREAEKAYKSSLKQTAALKKEMKELEVVYNQNGKQLEKLPNDIAKANLKTQEQINLQERLHTEYRNSGGALTDVAKGWQDFGTKVTGVGDTMQTAGNYMTTRFTLPIVTGLGAAIKTGLTFDQQMRQTAAIAGMTTDDLEVVGGAYEQLRGQAIQLGADSIFGATDVALAQEMMASAGFEVIDIISAIPGVMDLAAISGKDMGLASEAVAVAMNQFGLEASQSTHVANVFARAAADTNAETSDMAHALQYAGTVAGAVGWEFEQTAAAIGIMSNAGVKGSQAGTTLRGVVSRLAKPSKQAAEAMDEIGFSAYDAEGNMKQLSQIIPDLRSSFEGMTNEQKENAIVTIFGQEALSGMLALVNSAPGEFDNLTNSLINSEGAAQGMAEVINSGANGAIEELMGSLETLSISLFDNLAPAMIEIIEGITNAVESFGELDEAGQRNVLMWIGIVAAAGPVLTILGKVTSLSGKAITGVGSLIKLIGKWTTPKAVTDTATELGKIPGAATSAGGAAALFSNPWVIAGGVAIAGIAGFLAYLNHEANAPIKAHQDAVKATEGKYQEWFDAVVAGNGTIVELNNSATASLDDVTAAYSAATEEIMAANRTMQDALSEQWGEKPAWLTGYTNNEITFDDGKMYNFALDNLQKKLTETGQVSETEMNRIGQAYDAAGTMIGGVLSQIVSSKTNNQTVTSEWASAQITAVKDVAANTVEQLNIVKDARIANVEQQREQRLITKTEADAEIANIQYQTDLQIRVVDEAQSRIHAVMKSASDDRRKLNSEEVTTMMFDLMTIANTTGKAFSEIDGVGKLLGENLEALTSSTGIAFLESMGIIDMATAKSIASMDDMEAKTEALKQVLIDYGLVQPDSKEFNLDTSDIEVALLEIEELANAWSDLTFEERLAQVETRGKEEIEDLMQRLGVDWEALTPTQKEYYAQAVGGEALENIMYLTGEWDRSTDPKKKYAVLETQIDNEALLGAIKMRDLWNNADFMSLAMEIDTNAPDAEAQLANLVNYFSEQLGLPPLQMETEALTEESQQKLAELIATYTGAPVEDVLEFLTDTNAEETEGKISAATQAHEAASGVGTAEMDTSTNADDTTNKLVTTGNTLGGLNGRVATMTVNLVDNATVRLQGVSGLLTGLNGRVATSYVDTVSRSRAEFAEGGHITPFATGGNIQWGGMFANGGNVPKGFAGIVGEAGPEIFQVTNKGVSITPLSSTEKMRGVEGAIEDYMQGKGGSGDTYQVNINIDSPQFTDNKAMTKFTQQAVREMDRAIGKITKTKKRGLAT